MADIRFNIDSPDLPEDRINKHKDFKKLMYNYHQATKPLYKTPFAKYKYRKIFLILILVFWVVYILAELGVDEKKQPELPIQEPVQLVE